MASTYQIVVGGLAILFGVLWFVDPVRMMRFQNKLRLFRADDEEMEQLESRTLPGRVIGLVIAALGAAFVLGIVP